MIKNKKISIFRRVFKLLTIIYFGLLSNEFVIAQNLNSLTLDECNLLAKNNYPLIQQYTLIKKAENYSIINASKGYLPSIHLGGRASYQSDVTQISISIPNINIPNISKDQYKVYTEVSQSITDLFTLKFQKDLITTNTVVEEYKIEVELYKLKERINQLYFGILLIDNQLIQSQIHKKDIHSGIVKNNVAITNGVALKSSADILKAELLKIEQHIIELKAMRKGYVDMLSLFINKQIDEQTILEKPLVISLSSQINRPELKLFDFQKKTFDVENKIVETKILPRINFFVQGGYGRPGLNMLNNKFELYYISGVNLSWNISSFYTQKQEKKLLAIKQNSLDLQKETFLFNTNLLLKQQSNEVLKLEELIQTDYEIIKLREKVKLSAQKQLEYGTATTNDYLTYVNAEDLARQNLILHEIKLLMEQYNFKITSGN